MSCLDRAIYEGSVPFEDASVVKQATDWETQRKDKSIFLQAVELIHSQSGELDRKALYLILNPSMSKFKQVEKYLQERGIELNESGKYEYPSEITQLVHSRTNGPEIKD